MVEQVERAGEGAMREVGGAIVVSYYPLTLTCFVRARNGSDVGSRRFCKQRSRIEHIILLCMVSSCL